MNKLTILFLTHLTLLGLISCTPDVAEIKTVNFDSLAPDPSEGITVKQSQEFSKLILRLQKENTLNKKLKETPLKSLNGNELFLSDVLGGKRAILLIGSSYCAYSRRCFFKNIPLINDSLKKINIKSRLIKLVIDESTFKKPNKPDSIFKAYLQTAQSFYPNKTYIISREDAFKLNILNTNIYFINKNMVVKQIEWGASIDMPFKRFDIIKQFFSTN
ncbi:MAG: hypothetical protein WD530_03625 [Vicingaceae bacterium]